MNTVTGKYRKGKVLLDQKVDWGEGETVDVIRTKGRLGMTEAEWPTTPEGREELLRQWDALEPLIMSPEEEAAWHAALAESDRVSMEDVRKQMGL